MSIKFISILFIVFLSTFLGSTKGEEKVCSFSTPIQYAKCIKKNDIKLLPKYPLETWPKKIERNWIWLGNDSFHSLIYKPNYTAIKFKTDDGKTLEVTTSVRKYSTWNGIDYGFNKNALSKNINGEDILSWKFNYVMGYSSFGVKSDTHTFEINYIDEFGNQETLKGRTLQYKGRAGMLEFLLRNASGISKNVNRDPKILIDKKLKNYEKKATVISSIIKKDSSKNTSCFLAKDTKYPDLVNEYNNIYKTINPLRAKLDLPPSSDLKPLCN